MFSLSRFFIVFSLFSCYFCFSEYYFILFYFFVSVPAVGIHKKSKQGSKQASKQAVRPASKQCTKHLKHLAPKPWSPKPVHGHESVFLSGQHPCHEGVEAPSPKPCQARIEPSKQTSKQASFHQLADRHRASKGGTRLPFDLFLHSSHEQGGVKDGRDALAPHGLHHRTLPGKVRRRVRSALPLSVSTSAGTLSWLFLHPCPYEGRAPKCPFHGRYCLFHSFCLKHSATHASTKTSSARQFSHLRVLCLPEDLHEQLSRKTPPTPDIELMAIHSSLARTRWAVPDAFSRHCSSACCQEWKTCQPRKNGDSPDSRCQRHTGPSRKNLAVRRASEHSHCIP